MNLTLKKKVESTVLHIRKRTVSTKKERSRTTNHGGDCPSRMLKEVKEGTSDSTYNIPVAEYVA